MSQVDDGLDVQTSTVGLLMDHFEALVVDGDQRPVPWDTPGELWVRGYGVMKGYWNDESKTRDTITSDHWLRTG